MKEELLTLLKQTIKTGRIEYEEPMNNHTTFRVGGKADVFVVPGSIKEAEDLLRLLCVYNEPFTLIGNGSNVLVSDEGIRGVVVCFSKGCDEVKCEGNGISAQSGAMLSIVSNTALNNSLTGLEFASGIPGSVGGAIVMNAGAYGGEMCQVVDEVTLFDLKKCEVMTLSNEEMKFSYRHSVVKEYPYVVLSVKFKLDKGEKDEIKSVMEDLNGRRREKQPLEYPSAGSTFKRPEGYFAGKLIEDSGLKGFSIGGAQVSEKHCGFVINKDNAKAEDIINLIKYIQEKVYKENNVILEPEVCMIGEGMEL